MSEKVLFVDDDPRLLNGIERKLEEDFDIQTAENPLEAVEQIEEEGPFAVVVSDMRMPYMDGIQLLKRVCEINPDTVRIMLTGFADLKTTMDAVNEGHIYRFLSKPCDTSTLRTAIADGLRQFRLINAERELVEGTLRGSIKVLSEVLGLVNPVAFGRASRVKQLTLAIAEQLELENYWEIEVAAMLSLLGCVTLPGSTLANLTQDAGLTNEEKDLYEKHPAVGKSLLEHIPRLENVSRIIGYQEKHFDGNGFPQDGRRGETIPLGARILKAALDFDIEETRTGAVSAMLALKAQSHRYDPEVLKALELVFDQFSCLNPQSVNLSELSVGMVLAENVLGTAQQLLVAKGQEVTESVIRFLSNYANNAGVEEPLYVYHPSQQPANRLATS